MYALNVYLCICVFVLSQLVPSIKSIAADLVDKVVIAIFVRACGCVCDGGYECARVSVV